MDQQYSRRQVLQTVGTGMAAAIAGCETLKNTSNTQEPTTDPQPLTSTTRTTTGTGTRTAVDETPPHILSNEATPQKAGTVLAVKMTGEDNRELAYAAVKYGDRILETKPDGDEVTVEGRLKGIQDADPEEEGQVVYVLRDAAGNETKADIYPDETRPQLAVTTATSPKSGNLLIMMEGEDQTGLHEARAVLGDDVTVVEQDVSGQTSVSTESTVSAAEYSAIESGKMNRVEVTVEDTFGNRTRKSVAQYVRKFDRLTDTSLNIGAVYHPFYRQWETGCLEGRHPRVGRHNPPYPAWVLNRHIDQMSGFGIERVMLEYEGDPNQEKEIKRFLDMDLVGQIKVEPFYTVSNHFWAEDAQNPVDSYKEDLVKPHMSWMRKQVLERDNASTFDGHPVLQIWNPVVWAGRDYQYDRIMEEWGSYENFIDDIRGHLTVDGTEPFIVGGTNWWGESGYPSERKKELSRQFDGVTTWVAGAAQGDDGYASQEEALAWMEENFQGHRDFVDRHDMEFIPMTFPGFDERGENCGPGRVTPRSPGFFKEIFKLADKYRTTKMVNIAVYNHWKEATHIEPGTFRDNEYGTAYLEVVQDIQTGNAG